MLLYWHKEGFFISVLLKRIHALDKRIEAHVDHFSFKYPVLSFFVAFIGMPILILATVFFFTVIIVVPIALIFGWL